MNVSDIRRKLELITDADKEILRKFSTFERQKLRDAKGGGDIETLLEIARVLSTRLYWHIEQRMQPVWIATIDHKHGVDYFVGETEADVIKEVYDYVESNWASEATPGEIPENHQEALDQYFEHVENRCGSEEHLDIGPAHIKQGAV